MRYIAYTRHTPKANPADKQQQQQQHTRTRTDRQIDTQTVCVCVSTSTHMSICWQHNAPWLRLSLRLGLGLGPVQIRQHLPHILVNKFEWEKRRRKRRKADEGSGR